MKIKKFTLFENSQNTNGNTYGMGNVGAPQPKTEDVKIVPQPEPRVEPKEETPKNESVKTFSDFHLNEDGVATSTLGNTSGMGNVVSPTVSSVPGDVSGSIAGSGDLPVTTGTYHPTVLKKKKRKKQTKESRHFGTETPKEEMYITSYTDWLTTDDIDESILNEIRNMSDEEFDLMINENKKVFESIYYDLKYLKNKVEKLDQKLDENLKKVNENFQLLDKRLISLENNVVNIVQLNNLKTK